MERNLERQNNATSSGRFRHWNWLLFLLLLPFTEPQIFKLGEMAQFDKYFAYAKSLSFLLICVIYLTRKMSLAAFSVIALNAWLGLATIICNGSFSSFLGPAIAMVSVFMVADISMDENPIQLIRWLRNLLTVYYILNLVVWLQTYDGGLDYQYSFLGMDNRWIYFYLPWVAFSFIVSEVEIGTVSVGAWVAWLSSFVHLALVWSAGAMIALLLWPVLWLVFSSRRGVGVWLRAHAMCIFLLIVLVNWLLVSGILIPLFNFVISDILGKDPTLAGRTYLWKSVMNLLQSSPLLGKGTLSTDSATAFFYISSGFVEPCRVNHPHNWLLYYAFKGGIPALLLFLNIYRLAFKAIGSCRLTGLSNCFVVALVCISIAGLTDSFDFSLIHLLFALAINIEKICKRSGSDDSVWEKRSRLLQKSCL